LQLLGESTQQFGIRVHAYVLMDNHYHLLIETPEANLSRALHWINVAYSIWFNLVHDRVGHLFQGRFTGIVIEDDAGWQEVGRYVHLNPVRVGKLGLNKEDRAASREGLGPAPAAELVAERLRCLREFRWSSYRAYAGYTRPVEWLWCQPLEALCGGRTPAERHAALREYTEHPVRQGALERPWDRLVAGMVLGSEGFAKKLRQALRGNPREQPAARALKGRLSWEQILAALERVKGQAWAQFCQAHGDWGRDAALWLGRKRGRYTLPELGQLAGGMDYSAVGKAVSRFERRLTQDRHLRSELLAIERDLSDDGA
jgi:hypothetical protein